MRLAQELIERLEGIHLNIAAVHEENLETTIILHEELEKAEIIRTLRSLDYLELLYTEIGNAQHQMCDLSFPEESLQEFSRIFSRGEPRYVVLEAFHHYEQVSIYVCADEEILKEKNSFYKKKLNYFLNQK